MSKRKVVVTGLGVVSPIGIGIAAVWESLMKGASGVAPITHFDASALTTRFAAEVKGFNAADWMPPKETRRSDRFVHLGLAGTKLALDDAGLHHRRFQCRTRRRERGLGHRRDCR